VFHRYHSETSMMRFLKSLERKDVGLDTSMIPLGSCTMKLNAAAVMEALTWPEFAGVHPFAPADQAAGYAEVIAGLEAVLRDVTGFAAVSLQPNSGAQGEFTGLMVIRAWHRDRGDLHRDVVLIPSSAHGTNPASAVMAGMKVVVVACDANGNIDVADLGAKAREHADRWPLDDHVSIDPWRVRGRRAGGLPRRARARRAGVMDRANSTPSSA
jgi:glycine dehydrogenase